MTVPKDGFHSVYAHGLWNVICDRCGFKYKSNQVRQEWNKLRTCFGEGTNNCWEIRQPQNYVRGRADRQAPPWNRPEQPDQFLGPNEVSRDDL